MKVKDSVVSIQPENVVDVIHPKRLRGKHKRASGDPISGDGNPTPPTPAASEPGVYILVNIAHLLRERGY